MRIVEGEAVRKHLTAKACISVMRQALADLENGTYSQPPRMICIMPNTAKFGFMPAYVGEYFGAKVLNAYGPNEGTEYPSHIGYVMLFESEHCTVAGLVDATSITEIRTGAVSAVATDLLARKDAHRLAFIGAGAQARSHLAAIREVRTITEVSVYDIRPESARRFCREMEEAYHIPVTVCGSVREAVKDADIICTVSPGTEPVLFADMVKPGCHINAVGTFTPTTREVASDLMAKGKLYADQVEAMKRESGEFLIPKEEKLLDDSAIRGSIGDVILGNVKGRESEEEITIFDALGLAVEDVASAAYVMKMEHKEG